jgi:hypothetical protein
MIAPDIVEKRRRSSSFAITTDFGRAPPLCNWSETTTFLSHSPTLYMVSLRDIFF